MHVVFIMSDEKCMADHTTHLCYDMAYDTIWPAFTRIDRTLISKEK